ncbi:hypothetical protein HGA34_01600 [Candidatus Falkowbacteria bacterium]|nr:hypothetical protein [Candidatus Falkowbacteria bacterium]
MRTARQLIAALMFGSLVSGCSHDFMRKEEMHLVPLPAKQVKQVMVMTLPLHPQLDLAEGGEQRTTWPVRVVYKDGREPLKLHAVSLFDNPLVDMACTKPLFITVPMAKPEDFDGALVAVLNRTMTAAYGQGTEVKLKEAGKIDYKELEAHMPKFGTGQEFAKAMSTDSPEYRQLLDIYAGALVKEVKWMRQYLAEEHRLTLNPSSKLTEKQLEEIMWKDSKVYNFAQWLGSDWKILVTLPFVGFRESAIIIAAMKFITVPEIFIADKMNSVGYDQYQPSSGDVSRMFRYNRRYDACLSKLGYIPKFFLAE